MPYIGDQATANSKIKKYSYTATASQTDFSVTSNASDELQVFLNGVLLKETTDYTYTTSTVTLGSGATVSDIVDVHVYQSFSLADAVAKTGDTMTGELEVPTVKLSSNVIKASDGGSSITLDTSDNVTIAGDLTVSGGDIKSSGGTTAISVSGANTTLAGTANNIGTVTSGTLNGITFTNGLVKPANVYSTSAYITMGDGTTSPAYVLGSGGAGITPTLSSATSDVMIFAQGKVKRNHSTTSYNFDLLVSGGGLGSGTGDIASNTEVVSDLCDGAGQNAIVFWSFVAYDKAPASTTPTYKFIRNGTPTIEYIFSEVSVVIIEVLA